MNIFVFGDSIVHGVWDDEMGGWANRLRNFLTNKATDESWTELYELGVNGDTSENLLNRFEFEIYHRTIPEQGDIFLIAIGINDSAFLTEQGPVRTDHPGGDNVIPKIHFKDNLQYLITLAKKYSEKIVFVGLTPVNEKKTNPKGGVICYENKYIKEYNKIIKLTAEANGLLFIDVLNEFEKVDYKKLLDDDGLHPNSKGHQKIFKIVKDYLEKNKLI